MIYLESNKLKQNDKFMRQKCCSVRLGIASKWKWIIRLLFGQSDGIDINKYELEQYNIPINNSINYIPKWVKKYWIPIKQMKMFWNSFTYIKNICILGIKFCTSQLSSNWMSILKICMFTPLNAGVFISASFLIFIPCIALKWWHLFGGNERFLHPVYAIWSAIPTIQYTNTCGRTSGKKISKRNTFQSCASFDFRIFLSKEFKIFELNEMKSVGFLDDSNTLNFFSRQLNWEINLTTLTFTTLFSRHNYCTIERK